MESWRHDLLHGLRLLLKSPGFALTAIVSLAVGIGATTAIFSAANGLLLRPLPYPDADRIAIIWQRSPGLNVPQDWLSIGQYLDIATENTVFERVAAGIGASFNMTGQGKPERIDGVRVSSSFFPLFGERAMLGRVFNADDDAPGQAPGVILMYGFWQRRFGADSAIIGRPLTLDGNTFTVVGVMPRGFTFDKQIMPAVNGIERSDLILPLPLPASARARRGGEDFNVFAKLKPGVTVARAQAEMDGVAARMKQQYPANYPPNGGLTLSVVPLLNQVVGDARLALYVLFGSAAFVLLIACGNVANLLLARAAGREREIAIRAAVGADRRRIFRQLVTESLVLSAAGGAAGLGLAVLGIDAVRRFAPATVPRVSEIGINLPVLAFTMLVSLAAPLVFGLVPALRAARVDPNVVLKEAGRGAAGATSFGLGHGRLRQLLIAAQVALSVVLLIGAGLLIRSYQRITDANPGFNPHNALSFRVALPAFKYRTPESVTAFYQQLDDRLRAIPGVESVGSNYQLPLSSVALAWEPIGVEGYVPKAAGEDLIITSSAYVSPDYFRAMGIPLARGRRFTRQDDRQSPPVVIVDDKLAARFWPNESALGKRLRQGADGPWRTVVGVVANTKQYEVNPQPPITAYFPVEQYTIRPRYVVVRTAPAVPAASITGSVIREILALDPDLPAYDLATMDQRLHDSLARRRLWASLLVAFAAFALLLSGVGTYGVIAYWVDQRRREIGIRMALGAGRGRIFGLVAREILAVVGAGLAVGLVCAFALTRVMTAMLFGVAATDAATFAAIPVVIAVVAVVATYAPTRRATGVEPSDALRYE
ncbi:MAG TPA: ABC transporter permease [Gemmatimonadaceae bacterium]|nr:ABC transporter permease [Gemmatimonadaceae bacterium]